MVKYLQQLLTTAPAFVFMTRVSRPQGLILYDLKLLGEFVATEHRVRKLTCKKRSVMAGSGHRLAFKSRASVSNMRNLIADASW